MYEHEDDENKQKPENPWSGYDETQGKNQRKYTTGAFKLTEEGWRPTGMARLEKPNELEKKVEEES